MAETFNEDDELTRVLDWLKSNGVALAVGIVLGLAIIIGWQWWEARVESRAQASAALYGRVIQHIEQGEITADVRASVAKLKSEYSSSPYAANAALRLAAQAVSQGDYAQALQQLSWVIEHTDSVPMRSLARVRKARALWASGDTATALQLLDAKHANSFDRLYAELTGDIHATQGERSAAYAAYQRAVAAAGTGAGTLVLRRKLARTAPADRQALATSGQPGSVADEGA